MAFNLASVRAGIAAIAQPLIGGEVYLYAPDKPAPPCGIILPGDGDYHVAMQKGSMKVPMQLAILQSSTITDEAQIALDRLLSSGTGLTGSLIDGLQNSTLSGACQTLHVLGWEAYGAVEMGDERRFFGVVLNFVVYCDRK